MEWVLLTCEADFEECKDVCESLENHVIRLVVVHQNSHYLGSSFGSSGPSRNDDFFMEIIEDCELFA